MGQVLRLDERDLWALQQLVKPLLREGQGHNYTLLTVTLDSGELPVALRLREKVNGGILRYVDEVPRPEYVDVPVSVEELWLIDALLDVNMYGGAKDLLLQVFRLLWEVEYGLSMQRPGSGFSRGDVEEPPVAADK